MNLLQLIFRKNRTVVQITPPKSSITSVRRRYLFLGNEYNVKLIKGERNSLKIENQTFIVTLSRLTREDYEDFIESWYRRAARKEFKRVIDELSPLFTEINKPRLKIFKMKRAWGRCYYQKELITLNLHLIKMPLPCIEHIILHELCHFAIHNHGIDFKAALTKHDPCWRAKEQLLREFTRTQPTILQTLHI